MVTTCKPRHCIMKSNVDKEKIGRMFPIKPYVNKENQKVHDDRADSDDEVQETKHHVQANVPLWNVSDTC